MKQPLAVKRGDGETLSVLGTQVRFLCEAARTEHRFSMMEVTLPKDHGPPPHEHPWDEAYYIIAGDVRFLVGEQQQVYSAGDFIYAPAGTVHAFSGVGDEPARVLVVDAPATAEQFFRDVSREVQSLPADLAKVPQIGLRHNLRFLPPG